MDENRNQLTQLSRYTLLAGIVWTLLIAGSLIWNIREGKQQTQAIVTTAARSHFNKDQAFRYWATRHGGVYVPIDERTPPNPYLGHVPLRDIEVSGRSLTLMNPAYMLRQVMEEYEVLYGIKGHITSLNPLRPENALDAWERSALTRFEQGVEEAAEFTEIEGEEYFRLMRPMVTAKGCLKCHGHQGYKEGDIRGGVSVSVPMSTYLALERGVTHSLVGWHGVIWLLGLGALGIVAKRSRRMVLRRLQAEEALQKSHVHLEEQVQQRTKNLEETNDRLQVDITERKQAEEALVASERKLSNILNSMTDVVWSISWPDLTHNYLSPSVERIYGRSEQEFMDNPTLFIEVTHPDDQHLTEKAMKQLVEEGEAERKCRILQPDGSIVWVSDRSKMIYDENHQPIRIEGVTQDITERKRMEQALIQTERHRVANELSAGMCHNLNNILSGILGPALMLQRVTRDAESLHDIEAIISSSKRAADLVHLLHISVRGQTRESIYPIALNESIEQTVQLTQNRWRDQLSARGIDINLRTEFGEIPVIHGTESGVQEIIANLIFNAVDAMPEGGEIVVRTQVEGDFVELSFSDSGIGMDEETRRKVFEPFFTTKMDVGSGLGLSSLHGMLTHWGGKAEVESTPGKGTTFTLYFPAWHEG